MRAAELDPGRAALISLSASLAILSSAAACVLLQDVVPSAPGPAYALFPYGDELVAIGLTGGVVPLLVSLAIVAVWAGRRDGWAGVSPFRSRWYWLGVAAVALGITAFFSASHALYGGLGLSKTWAFWLVLFGCVAGVGYWGLRGRLLGLVAGTAECYVMGTVAVFGSDLIRTLAGLARAPGAAAVWGGGGLLDILFWFGLYMAISFAAFRGFLAMVSGAARALLARLGSGPAN
ncbi:MAG: hypothetical protein JRM86_06295 [Nitrososphaerota archaeon]|nr:hypothetical protein [Nitrososphaerota archaeon]MDG7022875.1 hypothetical protein [Nitrososphaerota archaeon]